MNKSTIVAILVFLGLAVAVVSTLEDAPQRGVTRLSLDDVRIDAVDRVLIGDDDGINLEKKDDRWTLEGTLADAQVVERVLESVSGASSSDLASRNPDRFGELEVDEERGSRVRLFSGGEVVADIVVGAAASGGSYVRSGDEVYIVPGIYRASLTRGRAGWLERRVFFDSVDEVERVELAVGDGAPYALVKKEGDWQLEDPSLMPAGHRFDPDLASRLVRTLATLRADDVLKEEPEGAGGFAKEADRLEYRLAGQAESRVLELGPVEEDSALARSSEREPFFTVRKSVAEGLRKTLADLRDLRVADLDPARVVGLEIDYGDETLSLERGEGGWSIADTTIALPEDFELDSAAVQRRLGSLASTKAVSEAGPALALDPAAAKRKMTVTLDDDRRVTISFGEDFEQDDQTLVPVLGNFDDKTYVLDAAAGDRLFGGIESFESVAPVLPQNGLGGLDPEALKNLPPEVRDSLLKQMAEQAAMQRAMQAAGQ